MANRYDDQQRGRRSERYDIETMRQRDNDWNRTHQWLIQQEKFREAERDPDLRAFDDPYRQNTRMDWDYSYGQERQLPARMDDSNRDDWDDNRGLDYEDYRDQVYKQYGANWREKTSRGRTSRQPVPSAGMGADYGGQTNYDQRDPDDPGLNYRQGDIGYESEGAFYQDLDEPINNRLNQAFRSPGRFTGIGPRNYQRSDQRIIEDVCERLSQHGRIDARNIEVSVTSGEVTLKGSVPTRQMKRLAEDAADLVSGVKDIQNQIKVSQG